MKLRVGLEFDYLGIKYNISEIDDLFITLKRANKDSFDYVVKVAINSNRYRQMFLSLDVDSYKESKKALEKTEVNILDSNRKEVKYMESLEQIINQINDSKVFKNKSEATVWFYEAMINKQGLDNYLIAPLYAIVSFYVFRNNIEGVDNKTIQTYLQEGQEKEKSTDFLELVDKVLQGNSLELIAKLIPTQYEKVLIDSLLGKINLGLIISDCKIILKKYKHTQMESQMKNMSDEAVQELHEATTAQMEARGLASSDDVNEDEEVEAGLAEAIEESGLDNEEVIALAKECGIKVTATKKLKESDIEDLAEVIEAKADDDSFNDLLDALLDATDEDADEDEEDADEDADEEDEEDEEDEDAPALEELLEDVLEESNIKDILEDAEVECKLTAKQAKMDAGQLSEVLEGKLDEESMEVLLEYLEELSLEDEDADEDADEEGEDDYTVEDIEDMDVEEISELCEELEIKVPAKVSKIALKKLKKAILEELELA